MFSVRHQKSSIRLLEENCGGNSFFEFYLFQLCSILNRACTILSGLKDGFCQATIAPLSRDFNTSAGTHAVETAFASFRGQSG